MTARLILVRHTEIHERYAGLCYGRSDVELSAAGELRSAELSHWLATRLSTVDHVVHSGLRRTMQLAKSLADRLSLVAQPSSPLLERDFGTWELKSWDAIHAESGEAMLGMLTEPGEFRPGGGETTFELRDRVVQWFENLVGGRATARPQTRWSAPSQDSMALGSLDSRPCIIAITHGGPIGVLRGTLESRPVAEWPTLVPPCGSWTILDF